MKTHELTPWLAGMTAGAAAVLVWHVSPLAHSAFLVRLSATLSAATAVNLLFALPGRAHVSRLERVVRTLSARLHEISSSDSRGAAERPLTLALDLSDAPADETYDEVLTDLGAALQDEERLRERREQMSDGVRETLRKGRDLAGHRPMQSGPLARVPSLLDEFEESVREALSTSELLAEHARGGRELAEAIHDDVDRGRASSEDAGSRVRRLDRRFRESVEHVHRLEGRSEEIGQVLNVINDITEQTNLLALNAAIIAAQAGEEGKGFGVVADEMRNLSERASSVTKETELLVKSLQEEMGSAVKSLAECEEDLEALDRGVRQSSDAARALVDLRRRWEESSIGLLSLAEKEGLGTRNIASKKRHLAEAATELAHVERDFLVPLRENLEESCNYLEAQWQMGALRDSLRKRLSNSVQGIRQRRGQDRLERRRLEERLTSIRESSREWTAALEEGRRRDQAIHEIAQEIRTLAVSATVR